MAQLAEAAARCYEQGDHAAARMQYQQALDAWLALRGPDDLDTATAQRGLGATLFELGEYAAGLVDEIGIDLVPVLVGTGVRYFDRLGSSPIELELIKLVEGSGVMHLRYRVVK